MQTFDRITSFQYGTSVGKVCKTATKMSKYKWLTLMIIQMKIKQNLIQSGHIFQITQNYRILIIGGFRSGKTMHYYI